jgi:glycosyltransferase involved in cell wall biosynthesis
VHCYLNKIKKKLYFKIAKLTNLYNNIKWHATSTLEKEDIEKIFGKNLNIKIANNQTLDYASFTYKKTVIKKKNELLIVFISRIHPKKNLLYALNVLKEIKGFVIFDIYGPIEDKIYWSKCLDVIKKMSPNIVINYKGLLKHEEVFNVFNRSHVFLFPTLGENYGHVISEALISGCPVIISDQTPWRNLSEKQAGFDIPLSEEKVFEEVIQKYIDMSESEYYISSKFAFNFALDQSNQKKNIIDTTELFLNTKFEKKNI